MSSLENRRARSNASIPIAKEKKMHPNGFAIPRFLPLLLIAAKFMGGDSASAADGARIINLTQTGCQFVESEGGIDHKYQTGKAADYSLIAKS